MRQPKKKISRKKQHKSEIIAKNIVKTAKRELSDSVNSHK